jgi:ATP-dependent DNA helicase RecQ
MATLDKILKGERILLIEKTGFGKSLCFQFPATIFDGTTHQRWEWVLT